MLLNANKLLRCVYVDNCSQPLALISSILDGVKKEGLDC